MRVIPPADDPIWLAEDREWDLNGAEVHPEVDTVGSSVVLGEGFSCVGDLRLLLASADRDGVSDDAPLQVMVEPSTGRPVRLVVSADPVYRPI